LQADAELLHSDEYLQAIQEFSAHVQRLMEDEHQLLGKTGTQLQLQGYQLVAAANVSRWK
jgi:hypothetical protein